MKRRIIKRSQLNLNLNVKGNIDMSNEIKDRTAFYSNRTGDHLMRLLSIVSKTSLSELKKKKLGKDEIIEALDGFGSDTLLMADKILASGNGQAAPEEGSDASTVENVVKEIGGIITKTVAARVEPVEQAIISMRGDQKKIADEVGKLGKLEKIVNKGMKAVEQSVQGIAEEMVKHNELPGLIAKHGVSASVLSAAVASALDARLKVLEEDTEPLTEMEIKAGQKPKKATTKGEAKLAAMANLPRVVKVADAKSVFGVDLRDAGGTPIAVEIWNDPDHEKINPDYVFDEENLRVALLALSKKPCRNVFCFGETGTGKTAFARQLSALLKRRLFRINFENGADSYNFIGGERAKDASTVYQYGTFSLGLKHPGALILLDELCFGKPGHLAALHSTLEEEGKLTITETGERIERADGVCIFAADNTNGTGDRSGRYDGLYTMNSALRRRFSFWIRFEYMTPEAEADLVARHAGVGKKAAVSAVALMNALRVAARAGNLSDSPSLPHAIAFCELAAAGKPPRKAYEETIVLATSPEYSEKLQEIYAASFRETEFAKALAA